jgi:hypothetical protein
MKEAHKEEIGEEFGWSKKKIKSSEKREIEDKFRINIRSEYKNLAMQEMDYQEIIEKQGR